MMKKSTLRIAGIILSACLLYMAIAMGLSLIAAIATSKIKINE